MVACGPLYKSMQKQGDKIVLHFDYVDGGLTPATTKYKTAKAEPKGPVEPKGLVKTSTGNGRDYRRREAEGVCHPPATISSSWQPMPRSSAIRLKSPARR